MVDSKRKGKDFEREAVKVLEVFLGGKWVRIPGSGAIGTILQRPELQGDIEGKVPGIPKTFKLDAKVGYGGYKQMTIRREWLSKIREEAEATYSIPGLICKFSGAKKTKYFVILDLEAFAEILGFTAELESELLGMT